MCRPQTHYSIGYALSDRHNSSKILIFPMRKCWQLQKDISDNNYTLRREGARGGTLQRGSALLGTGYVFDRARPSHLGNSACIGNLRRGLSTETVRTTRRLVRTVHTSLGKMQCAPLANWNTVANCF